ncbi:hypothetical protein ACPV5U_27865 [Vibrio mediterranei]
MNSTTHLQQEPPQDGSSLSALHPYLRFLLILVLFLSVIAISTTLGIEASLAEHGLNTTDLW